MQNPRVRTRNHLNKAIRCQKRQRKKRNNSDAARLSRFIRRELTKRIPQLLPEHWLTLTMLITGLLRSRDGRLTKIAEKEVYDYKKPSLGSRFERFIKSSWVTVNTLYQRLVTDILQTISANGPLVLLIDSTSMGAVCV